MVTVYIKQDINEGWDESYSEDELLSKIGIFEPIVVQTQAEFDYLSAMQLMIGKSFTLLLMDRDENPIDTPPSYVRITF